MVCEPDLVHQPDPVSHRAQQTMPDCRITGTDRDVSAEEERERERWVGDEKKAVTEIREEKIKRERDSCSMFSVYCHAHSCRRLILKPHVRKEGEMLLGSPQGGPVLE